METKKRRAEDGNHELIRLQAEFEEEFGNVKDHTQGSWIRGEVVQRGMNSTMLASMGRSKAGTVYRPGQQPSIKQTNQTNAFDAAKARAEELDAKFNAKTSLKPKTKKNEIKKKSQLELFKEEIKAKHDANEALKAEAKKKAELTGQTLLAQSFLPAAVSDQGDPNSTNIFIASIHPMLQEDDLEDKFGVFGPLASIKIMYPRTEDEKRKERNCAFVAFTCRKDAEKCMTRLQGKNWMGHELKLGWGKSVPNVSQQPPIHVPDRLKWFLNPPKPSKLPLNAQPPGEIHHEKYEQEELSKCTVRVVIPTDQQLVRLVNRVIEYVIKEGPMFEAILMDKESNNPMFQFLYDFNCPAHTYYRWRLYSVLHGETLEMWRTKKFVMYEDGPKWRPPILNFKVHGMPETDDEEDDDFAMLKAHHEAEKEKKNTEAVFMPIGLGAKSQFGLSNPADREIEQWAPKELRERRDSEKRSNEDDEKGKNMPNTQKDEFESSLRSLVPIRELIGDLMALCLEQSDHAAEIVSEIKDAIVNQDCLLNQRLARIYLMSDVLFNSTAVPKGSKYRGLFEEHMIEIFEKLNKIHTAIQSRFVAEQFKTRIMTILRAWNDWSLYTSDMLIKLNNVFVGIHGTVSDDDVDGKPLNEEDDLDGEPLSEEDDDIDGKPMDTSEEKKAQAMSGVGSGFVQSKWEVIDEDEIKAEAVTSAEIFAETKRKDHDSLYDEADEKDKKEAKPLYLQSDAWRQKMRQVEVKVIEYCEQLRVREDSEQAKAYRSGLTKQATEQFKKNPSLWEDRSPEAPRREKKSKKDRSRDYDSSRSRKRSRSREKKSRREERSLSRSRSRSRDRERRRRHRR